TKSPISNAATDRLLARYGSLEAVSDAPLDELRELLATQTYPNVAAVRLKRALQAVVAERGAVDLAHLEPMDTPAAMAWLETLPGAGRKIAAGVVKASTLDRKALVLDRHHTRILQRRGLVCRQRPTPRAPMKQSCPRCRPNGAPPMTTGIIC
ncbi:MAG: endonuclease III domain-containing protein, partial [Alphaproteobacteria bacterium]|nr:endonuclease III domain-containing protein [Alphaproteobacteria bacterium]